MVQAAHVSISCKSSKIDTSLDYFRATLSSFKTSISIIEHQHRSSCIKMQPSCNEASSHGLAIRLVIMTVFVALAMPASVSMAEDSIQDEDIFYDPIDEEALGDNEEIFADPLNDFEVYETKHSMGDDGYDSDSSMDERVDFIPAKSGCLKADIVECLACCAREGSVLSSWDSSIGCVCFPNQESTR